MAKGRVKAPSPAEAEASSAVEPVETAPATSEKSPSKKVARKAARARKGLRKHLKRLEAQLADAARAEAKRVRKLEKARWRRQLLEAFIDEARSVSSLGDDRTSAATAPTAAAPTVVASAAEPAPEKAAKSAPVSRRAAARKPAATKPAADPGAAGDEVPTAVPAETAAAPEKPVEAYCLREKKRVQMLDPKHVETANGGSALSGTCPSCGAALYKLVGRSAAH
jgi:hypothetical protein